MSIKHESGKSDDDKSHKLAWAAGGIVAAGTAGLIAREIFRHRLPTTAEEALAVFNDEDAPYHLLATKIMNALLPNTCASWDDLLEVAGKDVSLHDIDRTINSLRERDLGDFAVVQTVASKECRADEPLPFAHYEASLFAQEAYAKGLFGPAFAAYRESQQASDNS